MIKCEEQKGKGFQRWWMENGMLEVASSEVMMQGLNLGMNA
jgi:hypothetical protein